MKAFFDEGGHTCYVVRACVHDSAGKQLPKAAAITLTAAGGGTPPNVLAIEANSPGAWGNGLAVAVKHMDGGRFQLDVLQGGQVAEPAMTRLSMDKSSKDYVETRVNGVSQFIHVTDKVPDQRPADPRPAPTAGFVPLTQGSDGTGSAGDNDYIGSDGLQAFDSVDDVNIIAVPETVGRAVHVAGLAYCERRQDCFYIADCQRAITVPNDVLDFKAAEGAFFDGNAISSKYGALYAPWIEVLDPRGGKIAIPPSGAVAGRYAAVDATRGVHKAPAGVVDGKLISALGLTFNFLAADQERLNPKGINLIRSFPGVGAAIWGARTVSGDPEWRYLNVRRLFIFLRQSILEGTTWVVFEPNDRTLWKSIERNVSAFLHLQWLSGALVGATAAEAFYVKCDDETNPPESIKLGRVVTEIGVAPSTPAEFVIFRIMQQDGGRGSAV
ncbi:phage tail sheath C-terminal domain-containing protein [Bradyrhizobium sp. 26S5]|uniref:phage tail sheath family protein n=1 Tax=Bradyrhizobium sp. 26S5 TaxID=3139729 RepID=UPI0030D2719B